MMIKLFSLLFVLATAGPAVAHHGVGGFDTRKPVTLRGTVAKTEWVNPHFVLVLDVRKADGSVERWTIALSPPNAMVRKKIPRDSIKTGEVMSVTGYVSTSTTIAVRFTATEFTLPDGRSFATSNAAFNPLDTSFPRQLPVQTR